MHNCKGMEKRNLIAVLTLGLILWSCSENNMEALLEKKIENYFLAWNEQDFNHPDFSKFKRDTSYTWHGTKKGKGIRSIFNPNSGWKQWDKAWNGVYTYDIIKIDIDSMKVTGKFRETTDFLKIIGMPEGFTATVTFWFDENLRVKETLYAWNSDNEKMNEIIIPIVEWAKVNDSTRIYNIYLKDGFIPNKENAKEWRSLLNEYKMAIKVDTKT